MTKIKICGIRTLPDALAALDAGADLIGFNFYPKSPRYIQKDVCAEIAAVLKKVNPQPKLVGVFVNSSVEQVKEIFRTCALDRVQFHGDETPDMVAAFEGKAFKAVRLSASSQDQSVHPFSYVDNFVHPFLESVPASVHPFLSVENPVLLVDASVKGVYGGSGVTADWNSAAELAKTYPLLLAGGLTPENVAEAIRRVNPWGVDVASGVESAPGEKDARKIVEFVKAVRVAESM
jgi:phosphoribosylanthranilate isomerase